MLKNLKYLFAFSSVLAFTACQTAPKEHSGYLSSYEGAQNNKDAIVAAISHKRDDAASNAVETVFIQPAVFAESIGLDFSDEEKYAVLREVDRQICFEISKRFKIAKNIDENTALIRTSVVGLKPTGRVGSGFSAVGKFFIPVPFIEVRVPGTLGGLAIESEMLAPNLEKQIAFITWARDAKTLGKEAPSLSRIGDALQLAEPMGNALAAAFATKTRKFIKIENPDPCKEYGARISINGNKVLGAVTGVYVPKKEDTPSPK